MYYNSKRGRDSSSNIQLMENPDDSKELRILIEQSDEGISKETSHPLTIEEVKKLRDIFDIWILKQHMKVDERSPAATYIKQTLENTPSDTPSSQSVKATEPLTFNPLFHTLTIVKLKAPPPSHCSQSSILSTPPASIDITKVP